jgi:DNA-binding transcriptional MerR regulator
MKGYLSIGKVAKLKNVSIKSLRYYDEIGIFKPALTDHTTGYRYYKEEQLYILDAISLCIELGIPLKNMADYCDKNGKPDLQKLLADAKALAEQRIRSMYQSLDTLQSTMNTLEHHQTIAVPAGCHIRTLLSRTVLTIPFDEYTDVSHYNPKLLSLFVNAQKLGLAASYPSGLIYDYHKGVPSKSVFIHVAPLAGNVDAGSVPGNWGKHIEGLRTLPSGSYLCSQQAAHEIEHAPDIFRLNRETLKNCTVIETDLLKEENEHTNMNYEMQILL